MRESVGRSVLASSLEWSEFAVLDVDRLTALAIAGKVSPLGEDMYRLLIARDAAAYPRCLNILAERLTGLRDYKSMRVPYGWRIEIAKQAMLEVMHPHCRVCHGAGEQIASNGVLVACAVCSGKKTHNYADQERATSIGVDACVYKYKIAGLVNRAISILTGEIVSVNAQLKLLLAE